MNNKIEQGRLEKKQAVILYFLGIDDNAIQLIVA
jgi:hypothetical protein